MKFPPVLRVLAMAAALAAAFGSGWMLHSPIFPDSLGAAAPAARLVPLSSRAPGGSRGNPAMVPPAGSAADAWEARISAMDRPAVLAALRASGVPGARVSTPLERHLLLARFAAVDPRTALTYIDTMEPGQRADAVATVMTTWAALDPAAAAAHLEAEAGGFGLSAEGSMAGAAAVAGEWSQRDAQAAATWAADLPDELRSTALPAALGSMALDHPSAAEQFYASLDDPAVRTAAAEPLAAQWAVQDPQAAAAWSLGRSTAEEQAAALSGVTAAWMDKDPATASQWVKNLNAGPAKDAAIAALVNAGSIRNDPEAALAWASTISPGNARDQLVAGLQWRIQRRDSLP